MRLWLLAGGVSVALTVGGILLSTGTVHADVRLPRLAGGAPVVAPATSATPDSIAPQQPAGSKSAKMLHGLASWYGGVFHGRRTASGERFNMYALTACHPTLPFGSVVRVLNLNNRQEVTVRITDRGDLVEQGRIIDLSYAAARRLGMIKEGLAPVDVKVVSMGKTEEQ